jgi:molybdenum cofactor biosynthesis enzyme MoaA
VIRGLNDSEIFDFVEMTKDKDLSVRFIEFMPFTGESLLVLVTHVMTFMSREQMGQGENGSLIAALGISHNPLS